MVLILHFNSCISIALDSVPPDVSNRIRVLFGSRCVQRLTCSWGPDCWICANTSIVQLIRCIVRCNPYRSKYALVCTVQYHRRPSDGFGQWSTWILKSRKLSSIGIWLDSFDETVSTLTSGLHLLASMKSDFAYALAFEGSLNKNHVGRISARRWLGKQGITCPRTNSTEQASGCT